MSAGDVPSPCQPCTSFVDDYSDCYPRGSTSKRSSRRNSRSPSPSSPQTGRSPHKSPHKSPPKSYWNPGGHPSCSPPEPELPDLGLIKWHKKKGKGPPAATTVPLPPQPSRNFCQYDAYWEARYLSAHSWHRALHGGHAAAPALPLSCGAGWSSFPATVSHHNPSWRPSGKLTPPSC
jgi:hypothetical protein